MNCKQNVISIVCIDDFATIVNEQKKENVKKGLFLNLNGLKSIIFLSYLILSYLILLFYYYYTTILLLKWKHNVISSAENNSNVVLIAGGFQ